MPIAYPAVPSADTVHAPVGRTVADPLFRMDPNTERLLPKYEEAFGDADDAVLAWVSDLFIVRPASGKILKASVTMATKSLDVTQYGQAYSKGRTEVPAIAVMRTDFEYMESRYLPPWITFRADFPFQQRRDVCVCTPKEIPYDVTYTISIWTKTQQDMNYLLAEMARKLHKHAQLVIKNQRVDFRWVSTVDNSDLEPAEGENKVVRMDVMAVLETGIENDSIVKPTVNEITVDLSTSQTFHPELYDKIEGIKWDEDGYHAIRYDIGVQP